MNDGPHVSVVIPVHNGGPYLLAQLDAVAESIRSLDAEIVVVDNLSDDGSAAMAHAWAKRRGQRLTVAEAAERAGDGYARNVGIRAASAPLLLFCDADDVVSSKWATSLVDALRSGAEYVTGPLDVDRLNPAWVRASRGRTIFTEPAAFHGIPFAHGCNMGFTRDALERVGPIDEQLPLGCEIDLAIRAWREGIAMGWVDEAVVHYRLRSDLRSIYRQGRTYGRARPLLRRLVPEHVDHHRLRRDNIRRIAWLVRRGPEAIIDRPARARWAWVASQLDGEARSALQIRRP